MQTLRDFEGFEDYKNMITADGMEHARNLKSVSGFL